MEMEVGHWITIGMFAIGNISALIIAYINIRLKIKELDMKILNLEQQIKDNQSSFHIHEKQNEKMFDKFEKKQDETFKLVHEIKNILISKHYN